MKVYIKQRPETEQNGGIARVVEAQYKYLPDYGIELTDLEHAELTVGHVMEVPYKENTPAILQNHGMMWRDYHFPTWAEDVNRGIVEAMSRCQAVTAPSQWVRDAITRGMLIEPEVIYHGVDLNEWQPSDRAENFVLWNKARADAVSNPEDMQKLAELLTDIQFVSTLGRPTNNVHVTGIGAYEQMKDLVQRAGIYLCTARETFGIGTLEALASGVPVVGWNYGGQREIVANDSTGYLVPFGDYSALAEAVRYVLANRERLSRNAVEDVERRWQWQDKIEQYANLYKRVVREWNQPRPKVSIIVPAYNYAHYIRETLTSIRAQSMTDFECLVIDDCSKDNTVDVVHEFTQQDIRFHYYKTPQNLGLSGVRNYGFSKSTGKYIVYVDADDQLFPNAIAFLSEALDNDRSIHVAYGMLTLLHGDGHHQTQSGFPSDYDWFKQMAHLNQVPTAAMMRREVIEQSGGWRIRQWRAEDAEFWARVTSFGFRAKRVTTEPTLLYRIHGESKGIRERQENADIDGNWLAHFGWRSANTAQQGLAYASGYPQQVPCEHLVPFGAQGERQGRLFWDVWHRQEPLVTVLVDIDDQDPTDVLDSLIGQDMDSWEVYVVGKPINGFPFARFVDELGGKPKGALVYTIKSSESLLSTTLKDFISQWSHIPQCQEWLAQHQPTPKANSKVLMRYVKQGRAKVPFRVNGNVYQVAHNDIVWMPPNDAQRVEGRGTWERMKQQTNSLIPEPDLGDVRR